MRAYELDPHVFLGRVANGEKMILSSANESGVLWRQNWEMRDGKYGYWLWGPFGTSWEPMSYEAAYSKVRETMALLRRKQAWEKEKMG